MNQLRQTAKSISILGVMLLAIAGCKTSGWTAWLDSDSLTPSLSFDVVPRQSEPPIVEVEDDLQEAIPEN